jgi:cell division protein FtsW
MNKTHSIDFWLLLSVLILAGLGVVMVYSSSMYIGMEKLGNGSYYVKKQALYLLISLASMIVCTRLNYRGYSRISGGILVLGFALLVSLLVLKGVHFLRTREMEVYRWFHFGFMSFQPSELMKLFLIIYLSAAITSMGDRIREFKRGFVRVLGVVLLTFTLIFLEPSLSMAGLSLMAGFYLLFVGRARLWHILACFLPAIPAIVILAIKKPYMLDRIVGFLNRDPSTWSQVNQSLIGIGSGGLFGVGLGHSTQKFNFLPERHTDFIFSIIGEELGFVGTTIVLGLTLLFIVRGFKIAREAPDMFGFLLASGLTFAFAVQVFVNIGVATGILPTTGVTLPFISYGGSSLLLSFITTGILLNISKHSSMERTLSREFGSRIHRRFPS